jgi:Phage integrase family
MPGAGGWPDSFCRRGTGSYGGDRTRPGTGVAERGSRRVRRASVRRTRAKLPPRNGASPGEPQPRSRSPWPLFSPGGVRLSSKRRPRPSGPARRRRALGPRWWGDQDQEIPPHAETAPALRRRAPRPPGASGSDEAGCGRQVAGQRPGVSVAGRHASRCLTCPAFLPHGSRSAGLNSHEWTPRELRHSFVSLLSDADVPIEQISRLVGHSSTTTTETIYRKQIRPVIVHGADVMDRIFPGGPTADA